MFGIPFIAFLMAYISITKYSHNAHDLDLPKYNVGGANAPQAVDKMGKVLQQDVRGVSNLNGKLMWNLYATSVTLISVYGNYPIR